MLKPSSSKASRRLKSRLSKCDYRFQSSVEIPSLKPTATGVRRELSLKRCHRRLYPGAAAAPDHADAYNKRGTVRAMLGDIQAMAEFDEALRKDPIY